MYWDFRLVLLRRPNGKLLRLQFSALGDHTLRDGQKAITSTPFRPDVLIGEALLARRRQVFAGLFGDGGLLTL